MSKKEDNLLITAVREGNITYLQEKLKQGYFNKNSTLLSRLAWIAADSNNIEIERLLKIQILEQLHENKLSKLAQIIVRNEGLPSNLAEYGMPDLLEALEVARFTKQSLEVRAELINALASKSNLATSNLLNNAEDKGKYSANFSAQQAAAINRKYMGFPPHTLKEQIFAFLAGFGAIIMIAALLSVFITAPLGLLAATPVLLATILFGVVGGTMFFTVVKGSNSSQNQTERRCANNLIAFTKDESNITDKQDASFKIPENARAKIDWLEQLSPGLMNNLLKHFNQRVSMIEEYLETLKKGDIVDDAAFGSLKLSWDTLMQKAVEGEQQFCRAVTTYLESFEKANFSAEEPYNENQKIRLTFSKVDQEIKDHIQEVQGKLKSDNANPKQSY